MKAAIHGQYKSKNKIEAKTNIERNTHTHQPQSAHILMVTAD
jgi:hypothetical protein